MFLKKKKEIKMFQMAAICSGLTVVAPETCMVFTSEERIASEV